MNPRTDAVIRELAQALRNSAEARDWSALGRLDQDVAALLKRLQPVPRPLPHPLPDALAELRAAHLSARQRLEAEASQLQDRISHHQNHQEGLRAYHQNGPLQEGSTL